MIEPECASDNTTRPWSVIAGDYSVTVRIVDLLPWGLTDYTAVDHLQRKLHADVVAGAEDAIIMAQFTPTYTAGRHTKPEDITDLSLPIIKTDRAGSVTWHGPGQVVCYPVVKLKEPVDLIAWIRSVERGVIETVQQAYHLPATRIEGRAGVWLLKDTNAKHDMDRKICAIGLKVRQGATLHGVALNVHPDMTRAFSGIIPCGLGDAGVDTLYAEGVDTNVREAADQLIPRIITCITPQLQRDPADKGVHTVDGRPLLLAANLDSETI